MSQNYNNYNDYKLYIERFFGISGILLMANTFFLPILRINISPSSGIAEKVIMLIIVIPYIKILGIWKNTLKKLLHGIAKKYLNITIWSIIVYWSIILFTIIIFGSIKETDILIFSGIMIGEGFIFLLVRGFHYIDIMDKYHPHIINPDTYPIDLFNADDQKRKISDKLDIIQQTTQNSEVLKALELRRAIPLIYVHIMIPFFTLETLAFLGLVN